MTRERSRKSKAPRPSSITKPSLSRINPPAWYERVSRLVSARESKRKILPYSVSAREVRPDFFPYIAKPNPEDFDQDLSGQESERSFACHCTSDASECECDPDEYDLDESDLDECDIFDEEYTFTEFKRMRQKRKKELAALRKDHKCRLEYHKAREDEVEKERTELEKTSRGFKAQNLDLESAHFKIYSSDYMRPRVKFWDSGTLYIQFYPVDMSGERTGKGQLTGHIYFNGNHGPSLKPFEAPECANLSSINIGIKGSDDCVKVILISQLLLKLVIPRSIVYPESPLPNTPELLEFVGISTEFENERTRQEAKARQREVSPKESWFEMNHPMGSWNMGRLR